MINYLKAPFKLNLQLFAEDEPGDNGFVDQDEELDLDDGETEDADIEDAGESVEEDSDADYQDDDKQSKEENATFKKMRLKAEEQARKKLESELAEERTRIAQERQQLEQERNERLIRDELMSQDKVWAKADEEGVTEAQARRMLEIEVNGIIEQERSKVKQRFDEIQAQKKELSKDRYFKMLEKDIDNELTTLPAMDFQTLYWYRRGQRSDELEKQLAAHVQKKTLADVQDRSRRRVSGSDGGGDATDTSILTDEGREMANAFGVDPRNIAKYVKQHKSKK